MKLKPSIRDCTEWLFITRVLMLATGWSTPAQPFFLCAFPMCRCEKVGRCIAFDTYKELAS